MSDDLILVVDVEVCDGAGGGGGGGGSGGLIE
jgi:hypothetical protein